MNLFFNLSLPILALGAALVAIAGETWKKARLPLYKRMTKRGWIAISIALLICIVSLIQQIQLKKADSLLRAQRDKFEYDLRKSGEKIETLSQTNIELNTEIAELNRKIAATLTGGDNYCYFLPSRPGEKSNIADLMLINEGEYPLYDISIKIDDVEKLLGIIKDEQKKGNLPYDSRTRVNTMLFEASKILRVGNMGPKQAVELGGLHLPNTDKKSYNIYITARNGSFMQVLRFRRVNSKWKMAMQVRRGAKVLEESIDPDFPRNAKGKIDW